MSITLLARSFPSLEHATGLDPWNPGELRRWAAEDPRVTAAGHHAAAFVLGVWTQQPGFDVVRALAVWDAAHRAAFLAWARAPWWP